MGMKRSLVKEKSYNFALDIIQLYKLLIKKKEFILSRQLVKSGTSVGASVEEALAGQSRADFLSKMSIASKEARESNFWLRVFRDSNIIEKQYPEKLITDSENLIRMLTSIVRTTSENSSPKK